MDSKQLQNIIKQLDLLITPETSADYQAGVEAAKDIINRVIQEAIDRERMQQLEAELAELRAKYPQDGATKKRRGRKPKITQNHEATS
jgi:ABC-type Fe3+-citrate transport system substrate-binding protein